MPKPKATRINRTRYYKASKKNPKNLRIDVYEDGIIGKEQIQQKTSYFLPNHQKIRSEIPKNYKSNPNRQTILDYPIRLIWYKNTKTGLAYDLKDNFLGKIRRNDLKTIFFEIGRFLRYEKTRNYYVTYIHNSSSKKPQKKMVC